MQALRRRLDQIDDGRKETGERLAGSGGGDQQGMTVLARSI